MTPQEAKDVLNIMARHCDNPYDTEDMFLAFTERFQGTIHIACQVWEVLLLTPGPPYHAIWIFDKEAQHYRKPGRGLKVD